MRKYLNFLFRDQLFLLLSVILLALAAGCIILGMVQYKDAQLLKRLKIEKALVLQIDTMEKKIHSTSQASNPK